MIGGGFLCTDETPKNTTGRGCYYYNKLHIVLFSSFLLTDWIRFSTIRGIAVMHRWRDAPCRKLLNGMPWTGCSEKSISVDDKNDVV